MSFAEHPEERLGAVDGSLGGWGVVSERYKRVHAYVEEAVEDVRW